MAMFKISRFYRCFREDTRGTVSIEAVIILPALFWAFMAMAIFFDMYRAKSTTEKAAFAISDILSRETMAVNDTFLDSVHDLFSEMSALENIGELRVSVVAWDDTTEQYFLDWSHGTGADPGLTDADLQVLEPKLPIMVPGERLIIVQTFGDYQSPVNIGIGTVDMSTFVFTRPRFAPLLAWTDNV